MQNISEGLVKRGHRITVFTSNAPSSEAYINSSIKTFLPGIETISGVVVKRLPIVQLPPLVRKVLDAVMLAFWQGRLPFNDLIRILWAGPHLRGLRYEIMNSEVDLVVATSFPFLHIYQAFSAARKRRIPFVVIPCTHPMDAWAFENPRHYRLLQECQAVIANTSYEKDYLISRGVWRRRSTQLDWGYTLSILIRPEGVNSGRSIPLGMRKGSFCSLGEKPKEKGSGCC